MLQLGDRGCVPCRQALQLLQCVLPSIPQLWPGDLSLRQLFLLMLLRCMFSLCCLLLQSLFVCLVGKRTAWPKQAVPADMTQPFSGSHGHQATALVTMLIAAMWLIQHVPQVPLAEAGGASVPLLLSAVAAAVVVQLLVLPQQAALFMVAHQPQVSDGII